MSMLPITRGQVTAWGVLLSCCLVAPSLAETIESAGSAATGTEQSMQVTRQRAIADAERQALIRNGGALTANNDNGQRDTMQLYGDGQLGNSRVVDTQVRDGIMEVQVETNINGGASSCQSAKYRKKIAVTSYPLLHPEQGADIYHLPNGLPTELIRILDQVSNFQIKNVTQYSLFQNPEKAPTINANGDNTPITRLAEQLDAQFVVAGLVTDIGYDELTLVPFLDIRTPPLKRRIKLEMFIYDGLTGALLARFPYYQEALGEVWFEQGVHADSGNFFSTQLGEKIHAMLETQARDLERHLNCYPLAARVVQVQGKEVYINAGATSNLSAGDSLTLYQQVLADQVIYIPGNNQSLGFTEKPVATLTIKQVQPEFSIATPDTGKPLIKLMDIVRTW